MTDIIRPSGYDTKETFVDMGDGTHAKRVAIGGGGATGKGDLTIDAWGAQKVSLPHSLLHGLFTFDIPPTVWLLWHGATNVATSTNISSVGGVAQITANAAQPVVRLESRECPRYQPNRGHLFSTAMWLPAKTNAGVRDFGLFTAENGVFFRLKSDGKLYAVLRRAGAEVREELIDTSVLTGFDVEKNNIYDIQFQWRSAGNYHFFIGDPSTGVQKRVHTFDNLGKLTSASLENPALPVAFKATRTTQDVVMNVACADVTSENGTKAVYQYDSAFAEAVSINGTNLHVIVVRSPLLINGKTNTRAVQIARLNFSSTTAATFKVWTGNNPAAITGGTFVGIGNGSYIETNSPDTVAGAVRSTSVNVALMKNVVSVPVQALNPRGFENPAPGLITFPVVRGEYIVVTCTATSAVVSAVVEWGEVI